MNINTPLIFYIKDLFYYLNLTENKLRELFI